MAVAKKVWNTFTGILVALVVAFAILLVVVRVAGIQVYTVVSGSMEPAYHVGSIIYVKSIDASDVKEGDVITFNLKGSVPATHRVVRIDTENRKFYTKGDNNECEDKSPVNFSDVIGTPVFTIPYIGYAVSFIQSRVGIYTVIGVAALIILISILPGLFDGKEKDKHSGKSPEATHER